MSSMRIKINGTRKRFIAESPEEIQLVSSPKTLSLINLEVSVQNVGMLPDYNGVLTANPSENDFIINGLKSKHAYFDFILKSAAKDLPFKKLNHCFITEISYKFDPPEVKFHCDGVE